MVLSRSQMITVNHMPREISLPVIVDEGKAGVSVWQGELREPEVFALEATVEQLERLCIAKALELAGDNKAKASQLLEISKRTIMVQTKKISTDVKHL